MVLAVLAMMDRILHGRLLRLTVLLLLVVISVALITHYHLPNQVDAGADAGEAGVSGGMSMSGPAAGLVAMSGHQGHRSRSLDHVREAENLKPADLRFRIDELRKIKASVTNELRELESRRQKLHAEMSGYGAHIDKLKAEYERTLLELEQLKISIENTRLEQKEAAQRNQPELRAPGRILAGLDDDVYVAAPPAGARRRCRMDTCFDYSRCSLTSQFPVYFYDPEDYRLTASALDSFVKFSVTHALNSSPHLTYDPHMACVYVVLVGAAASVNAVNASVLARRLHGLPYWRGDGRNHIIVNLARGAANRDMLEDVDTGRAIVVQSSFTELQFRPHFDIVAPPSLGVASGDVWDNIPPLVPAKRKHLLSFQGDYQAIQTFADIVRTSATRAQQPAEATGMAGKLPLQRYGELHTGGEQAAVRDQYIVNGGNVGPRMDAAGGQWNMQAAEPDGRPPPQRPGMRGLQSFDVMAGAGAAGGAGTPLSDGAPRRGLQLVEQERSLVETLKRMETVYPNDRFRFEFSCSQSSERIFGVNGEWGLCGNAQTRAEVLRHSTFSLVVAPTNDSLLSSTLTQVRLYEALHNGAIPLLLGDHVRLPFDELLAWRDAVVALPKARVPELHFVLRSFTDNDLLAMRRQGRLFWESYMGSSKVLVDTILATVRERLSIPAFPQTEAPSPSVFNASFVPVREEVEEIAEPEDVLGPIEAPYPSPRFRRNFTASHRTFNMPGDPFHSYPYTPFEPVLPAEAKFEGSGLGFRPIGKGAGGSGKEFNEALGGNWPREQFTMVMLTYEREAVLMNALRRLKGLPHLNKVVVVWNSPSPPSADLKWPDIGVKIVVVRTSKNSLNNRFLPYDAIDTEAVLSIDDDAHLRHDEIMFGFRVWRESRERIVGFPGRYHAWDLDYNSWLYNANHSCELSMVLTGAAFFHKYYAYLYSYVMPQAIRDKVDEYMNCEDLAMNLLVSHITRQPPIKVTSRWTFRCPGCPKALSGDETHFHERHKCLNFFVKVYGYMPLLYTQYRVDSVLFKTRIPHDKQKCFKFI